MTETEKWCENELSQVSTKHRKLRAAVETAEEEIGEAMSHLELETERGAVVDLLGDTQRKLRTALQEVRNE